jgi:anthranilate phosphoribosyltransferase
MALRIAQVLQRLGCNHGLVIHAENGMDEIAVSGRSLIYELTNNNIRSLYIRPADFGLEEHDLDSIKGGSAGENAAIIWAVFNGEKGPRREVVLLNAAAALLAGDKAQNFKQGFEMAAVEIDSGRALAKLEQLIAFSQTC